MCGIAGVRYLGPGERLGTGETGGGAVILGMIAALGHRGPDGEGRWIDAEAGIALGHTRLAIIDLNTENGRQPRVSQNGRFVLTYNGELYNFRTLRDELRSCGIDMQTQTDTEVLLECIAQWGLRAALECFDGIFAFGLWDRRERSLHLVRDPLGVKPLYWSSRNAAVAFASELTALEVIEPQGLKIDRNAVARLLAHNVIPAPYTIYKDVYAVRPGQVVTLSDSGDVREEEYWSLEDVARRGASDARGSSQASLYETLKSSLSVAVLSQTVADVPVGVFLSGGIDSATVAAILSRDGPGNLRSYSLGFERADHDEAPRAKAIAEHLGLSHTEFYVTESDALNLVPDLGALFDQPFADSSQIPTVVISRLARQDITVALTGDGGDEVFGGYDRYRDIDNAWKRLGAIPESVRAGGGSLALGAARVIPGHAGRAMRRFGEVAAISEPRALYARIMRHWRRPADVVDGADWDALLLEGALCEEADLGNFSQWMRYADFLTYLPDDILTKVDRASMSASLEARVPLLSRQLVETAWRLPVAQLWGDDRRRLSKRLLRGILASYLPPDLIFDAKRGFAVPLADWLRGPLRDWAEALISEQRLRRDGLFRVDQIREVWNLHQSGAADRAYWIWDVLMMQAWLDAKPVRISAL